MSQPQRTRHLKQKSTPTDPSKIEAHKPAIDSVLNKMASSPKRPQTTTAINSNTSPPSYIRRRRGSNQSTDNTHQHQYHRLSYGAFSKYSKRSNTNILLSSILDAHPHSHPHPHSHSHSQQQQQQQKKIKNKIKKQKNNDHKNPTFQFKIGMQVGIGLGECYLQLQKLENSVSKLSQAAADTRNSLRSMSHPGNKSFFFFFFFAKRELIIKVTNENIR